MYYVSKLAKNYVKVLLSGEGGDEAFAGYSNYRNILWLERLKRVLPALNGAASCGLSGVNSWVHSSRVAKYAPLLNATFPDYYYSRTSNPYRYSGNGMGELYSADFERSIDREYTVEPVQKLFSKVKDQGILDQMLYIDTKTWLPDDLLIKADKMTMANSLELRVPLLDHRVLEFAASLPAHYKLRGFSLKHILKRALSKRVPTAILKRKKAGFPVPYESWMRGDLKDWLQWDPARQGDFGQRIFPKEHRRKNSLRERELRQVLEGAFFSRCIRAMASTVPRRRKTLHARFGFA